LNDVLEHLTFHLLPGLHPRLSQRLRSRASLTELLRAPRDFSDELPPEALAALLSGDARSRAERELEAAHHRGFRILTLADQDYPPLLRAICDPPLALYVWGSIRPGEGRRSLAVVGARAATPAGLALARGLGRDLAQAGLAIVSGLARGVDAAAHLGALAGAGRTVAVLGSGLGRLYPEENEPLAERIASAGGAVVSEFALDAPPYKGHFPRRNRIIAGWGAAVVVVEAGLRSGALVTARLALDEGRDVYAVPGHPTQETAGGTNQLIRDGAPLVRAAADILAEMGIESTTRKRDDTAEDDMALRFLSRDSPSTLDDLATRSGLGTSALLQRLTELELAGRVRRFPGALYVRS
jgi:DNA processing protein